MDGFNTRLNVLYRPDGTPEKGIAIGSHKGVTHKFHLSFKPGPLGHTIRVALPGQGHKDIGTLHREGDKVHVHVGDHKVTKHIPIGERSGIHIVGEDMSTKAPNFYGQVPDLLKEARLFEEAEFDHSKAHAAIDNVLKAHSHRVASTSSDGEGSRTWHIKNWRHPIKYDASTQRLSFHRQNRNGTKLAPVSGSMRHSNMEMQHQLRQELSWTDPETMKVQRQNRKVAAKSKGEEKLSTEDFDAQYESALAEVIKESTRPREPKSMQFLDRIRELVEEEASPSASYLLGKHRIEYEHHKKMGKEHAASAAEAHNVLKQSDADVKKWYESNADKIALIGHKHDPSQSIDVMRSQIRDHHRILSNMAKEYFDRAGKHASLYHAASDEVEKAKKVKPKK